MKNINEIKKGVSSFSSKIYKEKKNKFEELRGMQDPKIMFITCADSRINPYLITDTEPGDIFVVRNAGNVVPADPNAASGEQASIEFAVKALNVEHIIVCGHSDCGAMKGAMFPEKVEGAPAVARWLAQSGLDQSVVEGCSGNSCTDSGVCNLAKANAKQQVEHIKNLACVKEAGRDIQIHAWFYNIGEGVLEEFNSGNWTKV